MGVYILLCANGRYYIGSTNNLSRRLNEHNQGKVRSTKNLRPLNLAFFQEFATLIEARRTELKLKSFKNKLILKKIIQDKKILSVG
jgi:putative endonuclease